MPAPREPSPGAKRLYRNLEAEIAGQNERDACDAALSLLATLIVNVGGPDPDATRRVCDLAIADLKAAVTLRHAQRQAGENIGRDTAAMIARLSRG